jgi:hypothetical protein
VVLSPSKMGLFSTVKFWNPLSLLCISILLRLSLEKLGSCSTSMALCAGEACEFFAEWMMSLEAPDR